MCEGKFKIEFAHDADQDVCDAGLPDGLFSNQKSQFG
jgi:hypothetical protein